MKFLDEAKVYLKAGDGGDGVVAFRREKYIEFGGPDGGRLLLARTTSDEQRAAVADRTPVGESSSATLPPAVTPSAPSSDACPTGGSSKPSP